MGIRRKDGSCTARPNAFLERKFGFLAERIFAFADNHGSNLFQSVSAGMN
jgi:hypothetical protein